MLNAKKTVGITAWVFFAVAIVALSTIARRQMQAQEATWEVPTCRNAKTDGKRVRVVNLTYVIPRHAVLRKFHDVDYGGYRVFVPHSGKPEVLTLFWGVNASPETIEDSGNSGRRVLTLPDGRKGLDARGVISNGGNERAWRSTGVTGLLAYYRDVTPESAKQFDTIIDSVCFEKR
jgi:hypothetical protein